MNTDPLRDYTAKMQDVHVSDQLINHVLAQAHQESEPAGRSAHRATASHKTTSKPTRRRGDGSHSSLTHMIPRIAAAAACFTVLAAGVAFASGSVNLPGTLFSSDQAPAAPNSFALLAYAAENPDGEAGKTIEMSLGRFSPSSSAGQINLFTGEEYTDDQWVYAFIFDITCTGENIQSITYEIVGNDAYFESYDEEEFLRAHGVYGDDDPAVKNGYAINDENTFTVDYESQDLSENLISCHLLVPFNKRETTQTLLDQLVRSEGDEFLALMNTAFAAEGTDASQALAKSQLNLTATFADGSTQSKSYVIAPIEGFEEAYRTYLDARDAYYKEQGAAGGFEEPKLYTITEITGE